MIDVKALAAGMSDPKNANLGQKFAQPPEGHSVLTVTSFESKVGSKDRKTYLAAEFEVVEADDPTLVGQSVSYAWFIEKDEYGYKMADLRRFVDACARKTGQQDANFYAGALGRALDGSDALVGIQVTCEVSSRPYRSKAGKEGTATDYVWGIAPGSDLQAIKAGNAARRTKILGVASQAPAPAPVAPTPVRRAPAPAPPVAFDIDADEGADAEAPF